jgi:hypothetical protein
MGGVDRTQRDRKRHFALQTMMRRAWLTYVCLVLVAASRMTWAQSSIDSTLHMVEGLYASGAYAQAELEARRILENELTSDSVHIVAEQWIAFSLVAQGKPTLAREHFATILHFQPSYDLDPLLTSPKILGVFNEARSAFRAKQLVASDSSVAPETPHERGITFRTILFPGWEQWHQGRTTAGVVFLGAGVATLGAGITLEFLRSSAREEYLSATIPSDIEAKYQTYNRYAKAEVYAFAAFAIIYLASEIEVFTHDMPLTISFRPTEPASHASGFLVTLCLR